MKKFLFFILLLFPFFVYCKDKPTIVVFYSPTCKLCLKVQNEILPSIVDKYHNKVEWAILNTQVPDNLSFLIAVSAQFKRREPKVPSILIGDTFLVGVDEIKKDIDRAILKALKEKSTIFFSYKKNLFEIFKDFSFFTVIGAGLIDGINPCAFAVIVFFISFLTVYGYIKRDIVIIGLFYCLAIFLTYLFIGFGFFNFFYSLSGFYLIIKIFYYLVAFICFLLAVFSLYDSFRFMKTKDAHKMILQLPDFLKKRINLEIGSRLRKKHGVITLAISSFIVGFLVSLLEAVCTGQVYVPTIVFIFQHSKLYRFKALGYLLVYNLMFILPLIVIFVLTLIGISYQRFNNFLKKYLSVIKIILAFIFILLGVLLILDEIKYSLNFYIQLFK